MESENNKKQLIRVLCNSSDAYPLLHLIGEEQCEFGHDEADITNVSYMLLFHMDKHHVQVTADDTDTFKPIVHHVRKHQITGYNMRKHDGTTIDIYTTAAKHGDNYKS